MATRILSADELVTWNAKAEGRKAKRSATRAAEWGARAMAKITAGNAQTAYVYASRAARFARMVTGDRPYSL